LSGSCVHRRQSDDGLIQVWQDGDRRSLWFDDVILQSEIELNDPAVLPNPANRAMLAHLMFGQQPQRVLLGGCGGGAIARWFHARSPQTHGDAVELSPAVAEVAQQWFDFPGAGSHWQLHVGDVREFITRQSKRYDFILVDLEEQQFSPAWISSPPFLEHCHRALTDSGVLTLNLIPDGPNQYAAALANIRSRFDKHTLCLPVAGHDNQLVMAFKQPPELNNIEQTIRQAANRWGLPFGSFWKTIQRTNPAGSGIL